jgi:hypothetical protein
MLSDAIVHELLSSKSFGLNKVAPETLNFVCCVESRDICTYSALEDEAVDAVVASHGCISQSNLQIHLDVDATTLDRIVTAVISQSTSYELIGGFFISTKEYFPVLLGSLLASLSHDGKETVECSNNKEIGIFSTRPAALGPLALKLGLPLELLMRALQSVSTQELSSLGLKINAGKLYSLNYEKELFDWLRCACVHVASVDGELTSATATAMSGADENCIFKLLSRLVLSREVPGVLSGRDFVSAGRVRAQQERMLEVLDTGALDLRQLRKKELLQLMQMHVARDGEESGEIDYSGLDVRSLLMHLRPDALCLVNFAVSSKTLEALKTRVSAFVCTTSKRSESSGDTRVVIGAVLDARLHLPAELEDADAAEALRRLLAEVSAAEEGETSSAAENGNAVAENAGAKPDGKTQRRAGKIRGKQASRSPVVTNLSRAKFCLLAPTCLVTHKFLAWCSSQLELKAREAVSATVDRWVCHEQRQAQAQAQPSSGCLEERVESNTECSKDRKAGKGRKAAQRRGCGDVEDLSADSSARFVKSHVASLLSSSRLEKWLAQWWEQDSEQGSRGALALASTSAGAVAENTANGLSNVPFEDAALCGATASRQSPWLVAAAEHLAPGAHQIFNRVLMAAVDAHIVARSEDAGALARAALRLEKAHVQRFEVRMSTHYVYMYIVSGNSHNSLARHASIHIFHHKHPITQQHRNFGSISLASPKPLLSWRAVANWTPDWMQLPRA